MKSRKLVFAGVFALAALLVVAGLWYQSRSNEQDAQASALSQQALASTDSPQFGNADAPVHIVEFLDPACGTCRDFYPLVKGMMAANPGKIRVSVRYAPFHPGSDQVVRVLEAARRQGLFRQVLEALFATQASWVVNHSAVVDQIWPGLAGLGLDMARLQADMQSAEVAQAIARDLADAKTLGVAMTPEFFVNGKPMPNFSFGDLKKLVDDALLSVR